VTESPASAACPEDTSRPAPRPAWHRAAVVALLLLFAGLATWQAWAKSETYDEPMYILTGYSYVVTGDLSFNREHPPLAKYLIGLPLLLLDLRLPDDYQQQPGIVFSFYAHQPHAGVHEMLFLARLPGVLLGLALGLYVLRWASVAFGPRAGLAALALYATNPNVLAHSVIASPDFAVTLFCCATLYHLWRWLETGSRASLALGALTLGLALGSKHTALMALPVMGLMVLGAAIARRRPALLLHALLALFAAAGVLWLLYGGEARSLSDARQHARFVRPKTEDQVFREQRLEQGLQAVFGTETPIPLLSFLKGVDHQFDHAREGHYNYFHGTISRDSSPEFYAVSWAIKNPEGFTLLLLLGVLALPRTRRGALHEAALWAFPLLQFVIFSAGNVQLGFKYILPMVPFLCVAASRVLAPPPPGRRERLAGAVAVPLAALALWLFFRDRGEPRWTHWLPLAVPAAYAALALTRREASSGREASPSRADSPGREASSGRASLAAPACLLLAWAGAGSLARQPDNLMYFNELVGGPENGWRWSVIGDDWGQDTRLLGEWMAENGVDRIHYDYYGEVDPEAWGVRYTPTFAAPKTFTPIEGWVAVHVTLKQRLAENYFWLEGREPDVKLGHTIWLYHLTAQDRSDAMFQLAREPLGSPAPQAGSAAEEDDGESDDGGGGR
jgi:4-amino-4-deoxy-L-arabinose transferase-like glycosyltransferase